MIEAEDNHDSIEKSEGVWSQLTKEDPKVGGDLLEEVRNEKAMTSGHLAKEEHTIIGRWHLWASRRLVDQKWVVCQNTEGGMES